VVLAAKSQPLRPEIGPEENTIVGSIMNVNNCAKLQHGMTIKTRRLGALYMRKRYASNKVSPLMLQRIRRRVCSAEKNIT
jgi:hypothetical protein